MTTLYTNGCSYTANKWISDQERYPQLVANHFGWHLQDRSHPGSCNDRIIRCTMRDCIELLVHTRSIVALVQLTHLCRTEVPATGAEAMLWKSWHDPLFESIKPGEHDLPGDVDTFLQSYCRLFDQQAHITKLMCGVVGLTGFFQQHSIQYRIFAGPEDLNQFEPDEFFQYLQQDDDVIDLRDFNMLALTDSQCHPDTVGMRAIADYFVATLTENKL